MSSRPSALRELETLRRLRGRSGAGALSGVVDAFLSQGRRAQRAEASAFRAWESVTPGEVRGLAREVRLARGTITIRVASAADLYVVDRWLKSGGERRLVEACGATARRVRVKGTGGREPGAP